jgi:hypothetical protein
LRAERSNPESIPGRVWIASSLTLLAMTFLSGIWIRAGDL